LHELLGTESGILGALTKELSSHACVYGAGRDCVHRDPKRGKLVRCGLAQRDCCEASGIGQGICKIELSAHGLLGASCADRHDSAPALLAHVRCRRAYEAHKAQYQRVKCVREILLRQSEKGAVFWRNRVEYADIGRAEPGASFGYDSIDIFQYRKIGADADCPAAGCANFIDRLRDGRLISRNYRDGASFTGKFFADRTADATAAARN
jgi:hypothetical protein